MLNVCGRVLKKCFCKGYVCATVVFILQKQPQEGVLKNFAIFTGKHLRWNLFFNKVEVSF